MVKTYLVTGGCGFIGSHLVDALLADGHAVRVLDDLSTGSRDNLSATSEGSVSLTVGDVGDPDVVRACMDGVDGCYHLAAVASVTRSTEAWLDTHRANLGGTINVFDAAREGQSGKPVPVAYASSAAIYGDNPDLPLSEGSALLPLSPYGADKAGSELHARAGHAVFNISSTGFRFFNIFGPRQDPSSPYSGVISIFVDRILAGQPLTIFGDGNQTRDFVYVADVVRALQAGMGRAESVGGAPVLNVCTGLETSLLDLIAAIEAAANCTASTEFAEARSGDIRHSFGNPEALNTQLGVVADTTLVDGLRMLIDWRRQSRAAA